MTETSSLLRHKILFEGIWWLITLLLVISFLLPVYNNTIAYPFLIINVIYIITFITLTRFIFFMSHTFFGRNQYIKIVLFFLCIPFTFKLIEFLNLFITFTDEHNIVPYITAENPERLRSIENYIRTETLFFGVGSIIATVGFAIRLLISLWRVKNRDTV